MFFYLSFLFFFYKIREQECETSPVAGVGGGTSGKEEVAGKGVGG
jgi:hypothetical protein